MSFVLFVLGLAAAAAGILMIGFGIPINEFSLGNTLIIAGTTALASGLVVLGLSVVARQLAKIAEILLSRPATPVPSRSSDMMEMGGSMGGGTRMPSPRSAHPAEPAAPPRAAAPPPVGFDPAEDLPPPPPPPAPAPASRPRIPGFGSAPQPAAEANPPQRGWRPPGRPSPATEPARQEPSLGVPARSAPAPEPPSFDAVWPPTERRADRMEPPVEPAPAPAPAPRLNGDATHREPPRPAPAAPKAAENAPVSVLKSGVVDGMAYTLYTDGSIEAELAQGVVRFGSIEELRNHLEKGA